MNVLMLCWVVLVFLSLRVRADDSDFKVDAWTTEDGLPQSSVLAMAQGRDGYLWLGTLNGLVRFDGHSFTHFNVNNTTNLPGDRIVFLHQDRFSNTLWVGMDNAGLCSIRDGLIQTLPTEALGANVYYAEEDTSGGLWCVLANGRLIFLKDGHMEENVHPLSQQWRTLLRRAFHVEWPRQGGGSWILENGRVQKQDAGGAIQDLGSYPWTEAPVASSFSTAFDANITCLCEDSEGELVVGVKGSGIYWFNDQGCCRKLLASSGLFQGNVFCLFVDADHDLWAGTDGGGLYRIQKNHFKSLPGITPGVVQSVAEDKAGGLWVQDNTRGVVYCQGQTVKDYHFGAWSVLVDAGGNVWAGTRGQGLFRLGKEGFQPVPWADKAGRKIYALFQSHDGRLWVGSEDGLASYDGEDWRFYTAADGLPSGPVRAVAEGPDGHIWIGTGGSGVYGLFNGLISNARSPVNDISCLCVAHDGSLYAGTSGHGLARLDGGRWHLFSSEDGLPGDDVGYLIEDADHYMWMGSYEGLARLNEKAAGLVSNPLPGVRDSVHDRISCRVYLTRECSAGAQPAAVAGMDGILWFPTIQGLVSVFPKELKPDDQPPPVIIESAWVDGVLQNKNPLASGELEQLTLQPDNEQLEIHFTALNFSAPKGLQGSVRFRYRLEGRNRNATDLGGDRVVRFTKLPAGNYTFHVMACNEEGVWNREGARVRIVVLPPFWQKPWFLGAVLLTSLGMLAGVIYLVSTTRLKRELRILHQKELIERERSRIARDLHDQLGANLTQVALLGELAEADKDIPGEVENHARQIGATARETTRALDVIVWAVNPSNDTVESLVNYACQYAQDYFALAGIRFRSDLPASLPAAKILPEVRHNVFLAFKEAVNNVVKHAHATQARVWLRLEAKQFILGVEDNGRGPGDMAKKSMRNGIKNMSRRLEEVRGHFEIGPGPEGGTMVQLIVPLSE